MLFTIMRYLLITPDKSTQLPIDVPDEIIVTKSRTVVTPTAFKSSRKAVKQNSIKSKARKIKRRKQVAKSVAK